MKIYTKTGDTGNTMLFGGEKTTKDSLRIMAIGAIDEVNSMMGLIASQLATDKNDNHPELIKNIEKEQSNLLRVGADLATKPDVDEKMKAMVHEIVLEDSESIENQIDDWDKDLEKLTRFILPGGTLASSFAHQTRSVCRRAERTIVALGNHEEINPELLKYINRLSDWLFTLARYINHVNGVEDRFAV